MNQLEVRLRKQAEQCGRHGSPLTEAVLRGAADDLATGGVVADLLAPHAAAPAGSVVSLRLAGALHRLVLERLAPELAMHYPSVGGTAPVRDCWPAAERACREHADRLRPLLERAVQTNEVGRAAALYGALALIGGPVRLLEIGASAGLNLRADRFAYQVADGIVLGDPTSPVRLVRPWEGELPSGPVDIVDRRGCDPAPLDPSSSDGRLTLTSYVWADQVERFERLRGALELADRFPAVVERAGAHDFLARELAVPRPGVTTVVWHSVVWQYVDADERTEVDALLARAGAAASEDAPLARVSLEPERVAADDFVFRVHVQRWPTGERIQVADALGHGPPIRWTGARISR